MKKLIAIILIIALAMPAIAATADIDPIVGSWYMYVDATIYPELSDIFMNQDYYFILFNFLEDGTILANEIVTKDKTGTPTSYAAGKWEKSGNKYKYSIIGLGQSEIIIENDNLLMRGNDETALYMRLFPLVKFNPYNDYIFK